MDTYIFTKGHQTILIAFGAQYNYIKYCCNTHPFMLVLFIYLYILVWVARATSCVNEINIEFLFEEV